MSAQVLSPREAYSQWAASYDTENVVTTLEDGAVRQLTPALEGKSLLDAGCGTGRRLRAVPETTQAVGVDLVDAMLRASPARHRFSAGDVCALPLRSATFDVVWCRLVLGHVEALAAAYEELARVTRPGGTVVVSDFHVAAVRAGHSRTFRASDGSIIDVAHHVHDARAHEQAALNAGLQCAQRIDAVVNPQVRGTYAAAGALDRYERDLGLPLVLVLSFTR